MKLGIGAGIGLFLALIGLQNASIVADDPVTLVKLGDLSKPQALLAAAGFLVIASLATRKVPGAIIIGVLGVMLIAVAFGLEPWHGLAARAPSLAPTFHKMNFSGAFNLGLVVIVLTLLLVTILDTAGTLIGVARQAGFLDAEGHLPRLRHSHRLPRPCRLCYGARAHLCRLPDGGESRRHQMGGSDRIHPWLLMPLSYSIATGIGLGFIAYVVLKAFAGGLREINAAVGVIAAFLLKLIFA